MSAPIPSWTPAGLLPPISAGSPTSSRDRTPYRASLTDFVTRFATSDARVRIASGFLDFRASLHGLGIVQGRQWLDGSFLENIELIEQRAPRDVDVVTYVMLDAGFQPPTGIHAALDHGQCKQRFLVDNQFVDLSLPPLEIMRWTAYWYSLWSHRRDSVWKGFVEVDLAPHDDPAARFALDQWSPPFTSGGSP